MRGRPPATIWLSVLLLIAVIAVLTWQAIDAFQRVPLTTDGPDTLAKAGLLMGMTLGAIWLFEGVPALLLLSGARLWRTIVTVAALPGLVGLAFKWQPGPWGMFLLGLKATQIFAILLLYVGPSRTFFRRRAP
jgi:hypothetical protein